MPDRRDHEDDARDYAEFLRRKVEKSRSSIAAGRGYTDDEVNARMRRRLEEWELQKHKGDT